MAHVEAQVANNGFCWRGEGPGSFERCCGNESSDDCWSGGPSYNEDFCCHPLPTGYIDCWERIESKVLSKMKRLEGIAQTVADSPEAYDPDVSRMLQYHIDLYGYQLMAQPLQIWELACAGPTSGYLWSDDCECCLPEGPHDCEERARMHPGVQDEYRQCCFPVYSRRVHEPPDEQLETQIQSELGNLHVSAGRIASEGPSMELLISGSSKAGACVVSIRAGTVEACDSDWACPDFDCSYLRALLQVIRLIHSINPLPDMELLINAADLTLGHFGDLPVFTRAGTRWTNTLPMPSEWQLDFYQCRKTVRIAFKAGATVPWKQRASKLLWRGSMSNCLIAGCSISTADDDENAMQVCGVLLPGQLRNCNWTMSSWLRMPRGRLVWMSRFTSAIDAKFVYDRYDPSSRLLGAELHEFLQSENLIEELTPMKQFIYHQATFKYTIAVEGEASADRVFWLFFTGSVVIIPSSPWKDLLSVLQPEPFVHFVPVRYDLRDLPERLAWLQQNDDEAQRIARAGMAFAQRHLTCEAVIHYVDRLLRAFQGRVGGVSAGDDASQQGE
ncbi:unnamed protein product [Polarella glacialis]|uniref:Glycosyl transferase CAP10 domain-containing protein n=1 Tax=Polarella glacialis TaxID=89957 RepID=A0A813I1I5_POLGL|nr:unnamed protein product [Polarella glacialis]